MIEVREQTKAAEAKQTQTPIKVKKIGHVVYRVSDVERSVKFWTEIVGFKESDRNEHGMVFLRNATDHHTVALVAAEPDAKLPNPNDRKELGLHHFAMEVGSVDDLFRIRDFLKSKGITITYEGRRGPGSNPGVEFLDPDGYQLEVYADMEQIGWNGTSRPPEFWRRANSLEEVVANPVPTS
ncbi:MAG TPA: VOC family protein [Chloroflexota bacterium]|jgi:catechol 2,3-dioxygenase-like lactoylglutathione lyase family enzyme|nr:VOC family protein [Chloroflexota bacterium]